MNGATRITADDIGPVVLGAMTFGGQVSPEGAATMLGIARDAGVSMIDTSNNYQDGRSEEIVGTILGADRERFLLATKVGSQVDQADASVVGLSAKAIRIAVENSLRRLRTDYLDVCYLHRPDWRTPVEETLEALDDLVQSGKVRMVAQANFAAWQVTEMLYLAERHDWRRVKLAQVMYNLLARRVETEYEACARRFGLVNIAYNPLAGGLLTGKHQVEDVPADGTRFSKALYRERYWNSAQFQAVARLADIARSAGLTLVELSFRWVRDRPLTDSILLGASSPEQLRSNLAALDGPGLDADTVAACDEVWRDLAGAAPAYSR